MFANRLRVYWEKSWNSWPSISHHPIVGRCFYASQAPVIGNSQHDTLEVNLKVGGGERFTLNIYHPSKPAGNSPIIIFFRRGICKDAALDLGTRQIALGANATAIEINYPFTPSSPYPLPVHTALRGYDWIRNNLLRDTEAERKGLAIATQRPKIGVCGELVGGSLATMLALTECQNSTKNPGLQSISAVAVGNPIVDWTGLFGTASDPVVPYNASRASLRKDHGLSHTWDNQPLSILGLSTIRNGLFRKPEAYFDPFASPLLFFRTPSVELPDDGPLSTSIAFDGDSGEKRSDTSPVRKRRSFRKYPPAGFGLALPQMRVEVGTRSVLKDQGTELIELMQKSVKRTENEVILLDDHVVNPNLDLFEREGLGLWDEGRMFEIGQWFGEVLRTP